MSTPSAARPSLLSPAEYLPRKPHETVLYGIVRVYLATFLEARKNKLGGELLCYIW